MRILIGIILLASSQVSNAGLTLNSIFSDNMVLQKGAPVPIWGHGDNGERITVLFHGQVVSAVIADGKWTVCLQPLPYVTIPENLVVVSGKDTLIVRNVLVGEVWLCSGQSNMERQLGPRPPQPLIVNWEQERDSANYPTIREFYVPPKYSASEVSDVNSRWRVCSPEAVSEFSAVGYFFARNLTRATGVPVGIIFSAFGGTPAEDWISRNVLFADPQFAELIANYGKASGWRPDGQVMNGLYNGMVYPLIPYAIKGVCWYQGESNNDRPGQYASILQTLIRNWRQDFNQGDFPFLIVQIAPHREMTPELREAQRLVTQRVHNTALIVTTDCGDAQDIHPPFKQPVGERLALAAQALAYGKKIEYSGPVFKKLKIKGKKTQVYFTHAEGLTSKGGPLRGFEIAGADGNFFPANATVHGNSVIVSSPSVQSPATVRFGWMNVPDVNLYNNAHLPASPFRTFP